MKNYGFTLIRGKNELSGRQINFKFANEKADPRMCLKKKHLKFTFSTLSFSPVNPKLFDTIIKTCLNLKNALKQTWAIQSCESI